MKKCQNQNSKLLEYIRSKTSGKKLTLASWVRKFVHDHPLYKKDSIVSKVLHKF